MRHAGLPILNSHTLRGSGDISQLDHDLIHSLGRAIMSQNQPCVYRTIRNIGLSRHAEPRLGHQRTQTLPTQRSWKPRRLFTTFLFEQKWDGIFDIHADGGDLILQLMGYAIFSTKWSTR